MFGRGSSLLRAFLKFLLINTANAVSINKVYRDFKSRQIAVSKDSLYNFLQYLEDAYALFTVPLFTTNLREQQRNPKKVYPLDIGLKRAMTNKIDAGRDLECLVFQELRRTFSDIFYWKGKQEVDFCIPGKDEIRLFNVCEDLSDPVTRKRELWGMAEGMTSLQASHGCIITNDEEDSISIQGVQIQIRPFWKWVLTRTPG